MFIDKVRLRWLVSGFHKCRLVRVHLVDFNPLQFFLDSLCTRFKLFLNQSVVLSEAPAKEQPVLPIDTMSFDIKRPSQFWIEIKAFISSVSFVDRLINTDCAGMLQEVWSEQNNVEIAERLAATQPDNLIYVHRPKKRVSIGVQPFLITYVRWYSELLVTKASTLTAVFSPSMLTFCSFTSSNISTEHYTDPHEMQALCQLLGLGGYHFMDEKLVRLIGAQAADIYSFIETQQAFLEGPLRREWDATLNAVFAPVISKLALIGTIMNFRESLGESMQRLFSGCWPMVSPLVNMVNDSTARSTVEMEQIDTLANQLGITNHKDGMLQWALSVLEAERGNRCQWQLLPVLCSYCVMAISSTPALEYSLHLDALENGLSGIFTAFSALAAVGCEGNKTHMRVLDQELVSTSLALLNSRTDTAGAQTMLHTLKRVYLA